MWLSQSSATIRVAMRLLECRCYFPFFVDIFEFDTCLGLALRLYKEPHEVVRRLAEVHTLIFSKSMKSRATEQKQYDKEVKQTQYDVGDRVFMLHVPGLTEEGRKFLVPWLRPYRVTERLFDVGYIVESEIGRNIARVHVNRLKKVPDGGAIDATQPEQRLWTDVQRVWRNVLDHCTVGSEAQYKVINSGRNCYV